MSDFNKEGLYYIVKTGDKEKVELYISKGAYVNHYTTHGYTPLHAAAYLGNTEIAELLISHGADVNATTITRYEEETLQFGDGTDQTPLHIAAEEGYYEMVKLLISHGAGADIRDTGNQTPSDLALARGHRHVAKLLRGETSIAEKITAHPVMGKNINPYFIFIIITVLILVIFYYCSRFF